MCIRLRNSLVGVFVFRLKRCVLFSKWLRGGFSFSVCFRMLVKIFYSRRVVFLGFWFEKKVMLFFVRVISDCVIVRRFMVFVSREVVGRWGGILGRVGLFFV